MIPNQAILLLTVVLSYNFVPAIFFTICLISIITLFLLFKLQLKTAFGKVLIFSSAFIFLNGCHSLIVELYANNQLWKNTMGPFVMLFGPLFYFGIISIKARQLKTSTILLHSSPFIALVAYAILTYFNILNPLASRWVFVCGAFSFICYAIATFMNAKGVFGKNYRDKLIIFVVGGLFLVFTALLFLSASWSKNVEQNEQSLYLLRVLIYSCMLFFVLVVFNFTVNKLALKIPVENQSQADLKKDPRYERSILSSDQLVAYQNRLFEEMDQHQFFFDTELSLTILANHLKMPTHHLTQVFSLQIKKTFYQYINGLRLEYACALLKDSNTSFTIEELAIKSGFNSKISFNRQFKNSFGCTPTEYRLKSR